jgi:hypothetical protein
MSKGNAPKCIGISVGSDGDAWWLMSDGSKLSGAPAALLRQVIGLHHKKGTLHLLTAMKYTLSYIVYVGWWKLACAAYDALRAVQRRVGWPDHDHPVSRKRYLESETKGK